MRLCTAYYIVLALLPVYLTRILFTIWLVLLTFRLVKLQRFLQILHAFFLHCNVFVAQLKPFASEQIILNFTR